MNLTVFCWKLNLIYIQIIIPLFCWWELYCLLTSGVIWFITDFCIKFVSLLLFLLGSFTIIICYVVWSVLYLRFYDCCHIFHSLSVCHPICLLVCLPACLPVFHLFTPKTPCPHFSIIHMYIYTCAYLIKGPWRVYMHTLISSAALSHTVLTQCCEFYSLTILCKLSSSQRIFLW